MRHSRIDERMEPKEIDDVLRKSISWEVASPEQRRAFASEMRGKSYGWDALTQAWGWFLSGWSAKSN